MRIAIDILSLFDSHRTGIQEYTYHLVQELIKHDEHDYILVSTGSKCPSTELDDLSRQHDHITRVHIGISNKILKIGFFFRKPHIDKYLGKVDAFLSTKFNNLSVSPRVKNVVAFHDLSYERFPRHFSWRHRLWHKIVQPKRIAHEARHIIAVSGSTKQDLVDLYHVPEENITVTHLGVSGIYKPIKDKGELQRVKEKFNLPKKFILFLGTIEPRKNISGILRAFEIVKEYAGNDDLNLLIAGHLGWLWRPIIEEAKRNKYAGDIYFTGFIHDPDKPALYSMAECFVYPSFFEGFGFPPLEAMACGTPTITSYHSSFPEVVGTAALTVDPYRYGLLADVLLELLGDKRLQQSLSKEGIERAKQFTWSETAKTTLEVFEKIV